MPFESDFQVHTDQKTEEPPPIAEDRKLGDEWMDWDGAAEQELNEPKGRFLLLTALVWVLFTLVILLLGYLIQPRLNQWPASIQAMVKLCLFVMLGGGLALYGVIMMEACSETISILPYGLSERIMLWFLPKAIWVGRKVGLTKDQIGNSFIKVNNALTRSHSKQITRAKLLILLPRCLNRETRQGIRSLLAGQPYRVSTVGGGEQARKAIREERPSFIIAVACERDLMSGIRDVAPHIPVIGIPNRRPEGPCKNTNVDLEAFREAIRFFENTHPNQTTRRCVT